MKIKEGFAGTTTPEVALHVDDAVLNLDDSGKLKIDIPDFNVGDVVQLSPESNFPFGFMQITEIKSWGAQGFLPVYKTLGQEPDRAYYRAKWEEMTKIGCAEWVIE